MNRLSSLSFAALLALGLLAHPALAVDDPHAAHAAGQSGQPAGGMGTHAGGMMSGGMGGMMQGGMHEMMMSRMQAMCGRLGKEHEGYADVVLRHAGELKLSDEQIGKITRIHLANQKKFEELGPRLHETLKEAHNVYLDPTSDDNAIREAAKKHSVVFDDLLETGLKSRKEINAALTPDQLKQLQSKKAAP